MNEEKEWFTVDDTAFTNTTPGSMRDVFINTTPICPNMTNAEFRAKVLGLRDEAVDLVEIRLAALKSWTPAEQERVWTWFGVKDEATRNYLLKGFRAVNKVMRGLGPDNFVRWEPGLDEALGCVPRPPSGGSVARVCAPDTATHTICIHEGFCSIRDKGSSGDSKMSTIIHECSHFLDTFGSTDEQYTITRFLATWGRENPGKSIINADSLAGYIVYEF
ncbi:hypothetical protein LJ656_26795 [Paraburkholderia sp. MMS20-SJTR3]|uniref:Lysine-specific metallo-endopeptidase domain-containing protein n=1 Tax=Paraburkholderia sejongensis TaxID=2886946 RepID=A0ABS8K217_9BURK|nr:M35 family metallo-endopeptidase [Paraburkholderia sp. MMS20-SJTR3]MCC8396202.1 hypothetical protein [Paraburkholderia sp. MMS20-SJTR3]